MDWACDPTKPTAAGCLSTTRGSLTNYAVRSTGLLNVPATASYVLSLKASGKARVTLDGAIVGALNITDGSAGSVKSRQITKGLLAGKRRITIEVGGWGGGREGGCGGGRSVPCLPLRASPPSAPALLPAHPSTQPAVHSEEQ
jgi:hypothetical protein